MPGRARLEALKGSWEWLEFAAQLPAKAEPVTAQAASGLVYSGRCILVGASLKNAATTAGEFDLLNGVDNTGVPVVSTTIAASALAAASLPAVGILCDIGVYLRVITATLTGSVWVVPLSHYNITPPGE